MLLLLTRILLRGLLYFDMILEATAKQLVRLEQKIIGVRRGISGHGVLCRCKYPVANLLALTLQPHLKNNMTTNIGRKY
ncbi:hypothetical protein BJX70DRAFT_364386 [Aspergillus crustosus]